MLLLSHGMYKPDMLTDYLEELRQKVILSVYQKLFEGKEILLAAPTGRAARKMAESTGFFHASTLHSALGLITEDMFYDENMVLSADFVIVDETSMVDMQLAYYLFDSLGPKTKLLFVGDVDQLPSVGKRMLKR